MQETADAQLLRDYTESDNESAFRKLVMRYTDFVYSSALRQVESSALAADIAQSVFVDLARKARRVSHRMKGEFSLAGWLHRSTRYAALNALRDARRREANERQAMTQLVTDTEAAANWDTIRPVLDEAIDSLGERDRDAILLRFFENRDFRAVGSALGISDDAAQKRVSRAVVRLRAFFAQRGITVGTSGLAMVISGHAVQAAPAGLALTISTTALAGTALGTTAIVSTNALAMTTLQKTLVTATIVLAGAEIYTVWHASQLRHQLEISRQQSAEQILQLRQERDRAIQRLNESSGRSAPRLPAPRIQAAARTPDGPAATELIARILEGERFPQLTAQQTAQYLEENRRNAASLLAAHRTSGDLKLLDEAKKRFPHDPQVAFEAVFAPHTSPTERRWWLDAFKQAAPENALADYLSASEHFKSGQTDQAVRDLIAASGKEVLHDFTRDRIQANEEAYRSAGYSEADTSTAAMWGLLLPQASELRIVGKRVVELATAYQESGDNTSAQAALEMALGLGERLDGSTKQTGRNLVSKLTGMAIQQVALQVMDPGTAFGPGTVGERLQQLTQQGEGIGKLAKQSTRYRAQMTSQDWINYNDRALIFGEEEALRWLLNKFGEDDAE